MASTESAATSLHYRQKRSRQGYISSRLGLQTNHLYPRTTPLTTLAFSKDTLEVRFIKYESLHYRHLAQNKEGILPVATLM